MTFQCCLCDRIERRPTSGVFHEETLAVRLFIGNLPYGASEADLRAHFAAVAEPSHVAMPVDRETGRPRGFAFVEFAERDCRRGSDSQVRRTTFSGTSARGQRSTRARRSSAAAARVGGFAPRPGGGSVAGSGGPRLRAVVADSADHVPAGAAGSAVHARSWRSTRRTRRTRPQRQLRPACTSQAPARKEEHAAGTQASRPHQRKKRGRIYAVDDLEDDAAMSRSTMSRPSRRRDAERRRS